MRVLLVHQAYADNRQPGGVRHFELARRLTAVGHEVTIITGDHCYLSGKPLRRPYRERYQGIEVVRVPTWPTLGSGLIGKVASYVSFMLSALWAGMRCGAHDVVMGTSPPIFQVAPAWIVAALRRCPFVLEVRDLWPAFAVDMGVLRNRLVIRFAERVERFFYARASRIIVNSPAYIDYLKGLGIEQCKLSMIPNGINDISIPRENVVAATRDAFGLRDKFVVTYAGTLGLANDVTTMVDAAEQLADDKDVQLLIIGDGLCKPELERGIVQRNLSNITLAGSIAKERISDILAMSDACLATLRDIPMFRKTYPNKVFDYMAAGRPTVLAIDGVIREVMEDAEGGICVPPGDAKAIAHAVRYLRDHREMRHRMGEAAHAYVQQHFHRDRHALQLANVLQAACTSPRTVPTNGGIYGGLPKRILDVAASATLLVLLSPLLLAIAVLVFLFLGRPVLFVDRRGGVGGKPFGCLKFRTMRELRDEHGCLLSDDERRTRIGDWLRSTSLDELPQLWNVLLGQMSLVGPRPLMFAYTDRYSPEQSRRHDVRPGITGWAQINGRASVPWERRFELDRCYIDNLSLWLDVKILAITLWQCLVWYRSDETEHSESEFMGTSSPS